MINFIANVIDKLFSTLVLLPVSFVFIWGQVIYKAGELFTQLVIEYSRDMTTWRKF